MDPDVARRNNRLGLILFALALLLIGATLATAYIYNAVN
jgi:hypothetical protein